MSSWAWHVVSGDGVRVGVWGWCLLTSLLPILLSTTQATLFLLGKPIVLPANAIPFVLPWHAGAKDAMATVGLSQHLFDSALLLLQKAGALNLDVTGQLVRAGPAWGAWMWGGSTP